MYDMGVYNEYMPRRADKDRQDNVLKRIESLLQETEERFKLIHNLAPDVIYSLDSNGNFTSLNPAFEKQTGYKVKDFIGKSFLPLIYENDIPVAIVKFKEALHDTAAFPFELRLVTKSGSILHCEFRSITRFLKGVPAERFGIARDITHHKKLEEQLLFQNVLLETQKEASPDGILVISPDGSIVSFNEKYFQIWRTPGAQFVGKNEEYRLRKLKTLVTNSDEFVTLTKKINRDANLTHADELQLKDGRWLDRYTTPLTSNTGTYYGRIWFIRDVTEKKVESERQKNFIGIASHELKTPLESIKAYIHLASKQIEKNEGEKAKMYLGKIDSQVDQLNMMIKDFLAVSIIRAGKLELVTEIFDLDQLLDDCIDTIATSKGKTIKRQGGTLGHIEGDQFRLHEVFTNLLKNAIKYSPGTDLVLVKTSRTTQYVIIEVIDRGIGISDSKIDHIFELFVRGMESDQNIKGFGVGLYITSEIVKKHKGKLQVVSKIGKGSTFKVTLPIKYTL